MDLFIVLFLPLILSQVLGQNSTSDRSVVGARLGWPTQQPPDGAGGSLDSTNEVLQQEIDELKNENVKLKIQVDALENRINEVHPTCPIEKSSVISIEGWFMVL